MRPTSPPLPAGRVLAQLAALVLSLGCYRAPSQALPPAPIPFRWPELAFDPARQCHGEFQQADLARYLSRARLAMWLPTPFGVDLDPSRRCIRIAVDDVGTGRLVELLLRGAVPRHAVLLEVREPLYRTGS